ncbi:aminotransferase class I/II-fold pyridoxal phosphate-dependent enzyme [bacterium]|nr:aminotransferase class I/II-fold pyridoxal phosphate-dependent enzyme [bacterium]
MAENGPDLSQLSPEEKRRLLKQMLQEKASASRSDPVWPEGFYLSPEILDLQKKLQFLESANIKSVFFAPSEGINAATTLIGGRQLINFASYNYIGASGDPEVSRAAREAIDRYGTSVSASRLVSGERPLHGELEREIADFLGTEDSLVFVGGYNTNVSVIGHLCGPEDLILYDSVIHASVTAGVRLSGAASRPFPHNNWNTVERILAEERSRYRQVLVVLEGVYSMDGDIPCLPEFVGIRKRHRALLMVDEAHSLGVIGERGAGIGEYHGVAADQVDIWMGTLSKSLASCGGYIAGRRALIEYLKFTNPGFIYSVGISPPDAAAALAALRLLRQEPQRVKRLQALARLFLEGAGRHGWNTGASRDSAIIPLILGPAARCFILRQALYERGINVLPLTYPSVAENAARLRFFISSTHTEEQIRYTIEAIAQSMAELGFQDS